MRLVVMVSQLLQNSNSIYEVLILVNLAIAEINMGSWKGQASRLHVVYKVFPFAAGSPQEVMVYGLSKYWYEDGTTGQMPWAARLHFQRSKEHVAIDFYQIYAVSGLAPKCAHGVLTNS